VGGEVAAQALLGLARVEAAAGRASEAEAAYRRLRDSAGSLTDGEGIPYELLADLGAARARPEPVHDLALYARLAEEPKPGSTSAPTRARLAAAGSVRNRMEPTRLAAEKRERLRALDAQLARQRQELAVATSWVGAAAADRVRAAPPEPLRGPPGHRHRQGRRGQLGAGDAHSRTRARRRA
jgi:hypothetical protein